MKLSLCESIHKCSPVDLHFVRFFSSVLKVCFFHSMCSNITLKIHVLCPETPFLESLFSLGSVRDKQHLLLHVPSVPVAKQVSVIIINGSDIYIVHYDIFIFIFNILWH